LVWAWPAQGQTVGGFDEAKNKGIDIAGQAGDAVLGLGIFGLAELT
jgi:lipoprotein NlpD